MSEQTCCQCHCACHFSYEALCNQAEPCCEQCPVCRDHVRLGSLSEHMSLCIEQAVARLHGEFQNRETELICRLLRDADAMRDLYNRMGGSLEAVRRLLVRLTGDDVVRNWLIEELRRALVQEVK